VPNDRHARHENTSAPCLKAKPRVKLKSDKGQRSRKARWGARWHKVTFTLEPKPLTRDIDTSFSYFLLQKFPPILSFGLFSLAHNTSRKCKNSRCQRKYWFLCFLSLRPRSVRLLIYIYNIFFQSVFLTL